MKITINKVAHHALLIDASHLNQLDAFISSAFTNVSRIAKCIDGTELSNCLMTEITGFDNPTSRRIQSVTIDAHGPAGESLTVILGSEFSSTATIRISSNDDATAVARAHELRRRMTDMKPAYSALARLNILLAVCLVWAAAAVIITALKIFGMRPWTPPSVTYSSLEVFNAAVVFVLLLAAATYPLDLLRAWLFPKVFFLLGRQVDAMEFRKKWRWFVLTALIAGPVIKLIIDRVRN